MAVGLAYPRHVSEEVDLLARALGAAREFHLFLDYGGTLVPGPVGPESKPDPGLLDRIEDLCEVESCSVYVVSGRTVEELDAAFGIPSLGFVGQRGFEIRRPEEPIVYPVEPGTAGTLLHHVELDAHRCLGDCDGLDIVSRGFGLALNLACEEASVERDAVRCFVKLVRSLDTQRQLEILYGEKTVEARIAGWHKGDAVGHILREDDLEDGLAIYVGDDVTDEDAFEALALWSQDEELDAPWYLAGVDEEDEEPPRGISILVAPQPRPTMASLFVRGPDEVFEFLSSLSAITSALL